MKTPIIDITGRDQPYGYARQDDVMRRMEEEERERKEAEDIQAIRASRVQRAMTEAEDLPMVRCIDCREKEFRRDPGFFYCTGIIQGGMIIMNPLKEGKCAKFERASRWRQLMDKLAHKRHYGRRGDKA